MKEIKIAPINIDGKILVVEDNPGFNYGYVIYIPNTICKDATLIVEGSNVPLTKTTIEAANELVYEKAINPMLPIYTIATQLGLPILYPLFPRYYNGNETIYNHMLSSNSLDKNLKEKSLERVDLQLINMIKDCKEVLLQKGINIDDKIIIDGFSTSAKFANRFTLLHPEIVKLCIAGGISGALTLPIETINNEKLLWPVGIGNLKELNDIEVNIEEFKKVPQFYYMGLKDNNDPFQKEDKEIGIIEDNEMEQMHKILGKNMVEERWPTSMNFYKDLGINAIFKSYNTGHDPRPAQEDIKEEINNILNKQNNLLKR